MNVVKGRVFVKGLNTGIGNLEVVIYDLDPDARQANQPGAGGNDDVSSLFAGSPGLRTWADFPGDRIGSVLTDARGRFELEYEDAEFKGAGAERRPDLVLLVLAPDERASDAVYVGTSPMGRILHASFVFRANAGRVESYSIALKPAVLSQLGVAYPGAGRTPTAESEHVEDGIRKQLELQAGVTRAIRAQVEARREQVSRVLDARGAS
jgi:hypothetical protein